MLSSNNNQIHSFEKPIQIHDENGNPISTFDQNQQQLIDCYNYNYNYNNNFNPFLDEEEEFILLYSQKQLLLSTTHNNFGPQMELESGNNINEETTQKAPSQKKAISRKRSSNKDRHSKISTLRGPRDRRMRLSLEIARNFFNLQDMLGFDKASKTVEWLFAKSRNAIKELKEKYLSGNNHVLQISNKSCEFEEMDHKKKKRRKFRVVDKESRYKARARARERTRAKLNLRLQKSKCDFEGNPIGVCKMEDLIEENGTKINDLFHAQNQEILADKCQNSASSLGTVSLDNMKASPAGLKLLELDEIDRVLIFYGE